MHKNKEAQNSNTNNESKLYFRYTEYPDKNKEDFLKL